MQFILDPLPHIKELEKNISIMLINSHRSTDEPRPTISGLVSVGGAHIKPVKTLPNDLKVSMFSLSFLFCFFNTITCSQKFFNNLFLGIYG